jgi:5-methylcytosine-specific restriction endonuclease McrA
MNICPCTTKSNSTVMSESPQEFLFQDDAELVSELRAIRQRQVERLQYEEARKVAWYAGTPFPEDELKYRAFSTDYPRDKERERMNAEYREWYAEHSEWKKQYVHAQRAQKLGRKVGDRGPILRVYARARSVEMLYCHWCKRSTPVEERAVDHIIPLARGGNHTARNLCICCWSCNQAKSDRLPEDYLESIKLTRKRNLAIRRHGLERQLQFEFVDSVSRRRRPPQRATQLTLVRLRA